MLCDICYLEVTDGVVVPGFGKPAGVRHIDCIINATLKFAEDPLKEGMLRRLIEYEKSHAVQDWARDVSGGSADVCWEWSDVNIPPYKIASFIRTGLVTIVFKTNSSTNYALVGRQLIEEALNDVKQEHQENSCVDEIPSDLFDCIVGYDDIKEEMKFTLNAGKTNHYLLIGPPATAKSLFLMELRRLKNTYSAAGSRVTAAGLTEALLNYRPRLLLLDEIDKMPADATAVLLSVMETGQVLVTKHKTHQQADLSLTVFAAGNTDRKTSPELLSRFDGKFYIHGYSFDDFIEVCTKFLSKHEGLPEELAGYIGKQTWTLLDSDVRTARGIARQIREHTASEVDRVIGIRRKYAKNSLPVSAGLRREATP